MAERKPIGASLPNGCLATFLPQGLPRLSPPQEQTNLPARRLPRLPGTRRGQARGSERRSEGGGLTHAAAPSSNRDGYSTTSASNTRAENASEVGRSTNCRIDVHANPAAIIAAHYALAVDQRLRREPCPALAMALVNRGMRGYACAHQPPRCAERGPLLFVFAWAASARLA